MLPFHPGCLIQLTFTSPEANGINTQQKAMFFCKMVDLSKHFTFSSPQVQLRRRSIYALECPVNIERDLPQWCSYKKSNPLSHPAFLNRCLHEGTNRVFSNTLLSLNQPSLIQRNLANRSTIHALPNEGPIKQGRVRNPAPSFLQRVCQTS